MAAAYGVTFDEKTTEIISSLQKTFGVSSNAEVIQRALALAQRVAEQASADHKILIGGKDDFIKLDLTK